MSGLLNADVIAKAAQSPLGILALLILVVATLALVLFRGAPVAVRLFVFLLIFGAATAFGTAVVREGSHAKDPQREAKLRDLERQLAAVGSETRALQVEIHSTREAIQQAQAARDQAKVEELQQRLAAAQARSAAATDRLQALVIQQRELTQQ